ARQPDDEDRIPCGAAQSGPLAKKLCGKKVVGPRQPIVMLIRVVAKLQAAQSVPLGVVQEGLLELPVVLQRLAERKVEMEPLVWIQFRRIQRGAHRADILRRESKGLQVRKAPVRLSQFRYELDALAIGSDALFVVPGGLQCVPEAHPDLRLIRILVQHFPVELQRGLVFADRSEDCRLEVTVADGRRLARKTAGDGGDRLRRLVLTM